LPHFEYSTSPSRVKTFDSQDSATGPARRDPSLPTFHDVVTHSDGIAAPGDPPDEKPPKDPGPVQVVESITQVLHIIRFPVPDMVDAI
jgi:hypothetical protein